MDLIRRQRRWPCSDQSSGPGPGEGQRDAIPARLFVGLLGPARSAHTRARARKRRQVAYEEDDPFSSLCRCTISLSLSLSPRMSDDPRRRSLSCGKTMRRRSAATIQPPSAPPPPLSSISSPPLSLGAVVPKTADESSRPRALRAVP